ncbi:MAG TPA: DMT family transporter [Usitatibacter sp.]|nr:DMT family transporter [Usitatibacter sp.]
MTGDGRAEGLAAIVLWGALALLALKLARVPPFLLTGIALLIGAVVGGRALAHRPPPPAALALGVYGLFGFHFFLFLALRRAPPVEANLVNYLWPLLIVVLAPAIVPGVRFSARHGLAALLGFSGAALLVTADSGRLGAGELLGYAFAAVSALIWSTYSLMTRRLRHFPTAYVSWFCLVSGLASLACHFLFEPRYWPRDEEWLYLVALGLGPMGAAFFLWDRAMKKGDPRAIGNLAYITPLLSTIALVAFAGAAFTPMSFAAMALILAGAWLGK